MSDSNKGVKLKELSIDDYKIFKNFKISFCGKRDNPLPVILLVGVNGSGKTTILESIQNSYNTGTKLKIFYENKTIDADSFGGINADKIVPKGHNINDVKNNLIYISFNRSLEDIKELLPKHIKKLIYENDIKASEVYKNIKDEINNIFESLDIKVEFSRRDAEGNIYFKNKISKEEFTIDHLSTGEKTLLSKVLYLYFKDVKNQIILIDEPELSLHPAWQNRVLKLYENFAIKNNCQIIIATHSPQIIGSAKPEYLRILTFQDNSVKVLDNFNKSYGLEFSKVLLDIMGVEELRALEVEEKFIKLKRYIQEKDSKRFVELFTELEDILGSDDTDLQLLKLQANLKGLNVSSS